jgi:hypothetical protein
MSLRARRIAARARPAPQDLEVATAWPALQDLPTVENPQPAERSEGALRSAPARAAAGHADRRWV